MSTVTTSPMQTAAAPSPAAVMPCRADVIVEDMITVPGWINTLAEYRRWAESEDYPQSGWVSYLDGVIFVDLNMEEFLTHNQVKHAFDGMFFALFAEHRTGRFVPDRMLLVNE